MYYKRSKLFNPQLPSQPRIKPLQSSLHLLHSQPQQLVEFEKLLIRINDHISNTITKRPTLPLR